MNCIELKTISKSYPGFQLQDISLQLPQGMILGLVGENGAGKTTLLKILLGIVKADGGSCRVLGTDNLPVSPKVKEELGVVLDEVFLPYTMNAREIEKILGMIYHNWNRRKYQRLLKELHIPAEKKFKELSRGNKMKLGIACALSHEPRLLILDEATSGLDPVVRDEVLDMLLDFIQNQENSVLISSHIVSDLEKACDRIAFLHEGRLLLMEDKRTLQHQYGKILAPSGEPPVLPYEAILRQRKTKQGVEYLVKRESLSPDLRVQPLSLEELFIMMVKGGKDERTGI